MATIQTLEAHAPLRQYFAQSTVPCASALDLSSADANLRAWLPSRCASVQHVHTLDAPGALESQQRFSVVCLCQTLQHLGTADAVRDALRHALQYASADGHLIVDHYPVRVDAGNATYMRENGGGDAALPARWNLLAEPFSLPRPAVFAPDLHADASAQRRYVCAWQVAALRALPWYESPPPSSTTPVAPVVPAAAAAACKHLHVVLFRVTEQWFGEVADALQQALQSLPHVTYETRAESSLHELGDARAARCRPAHATRDLHLLAMLPNCAPPMQSVMVRCVATGDNRVPVAAWYWEQPASHFMRTLHRDWFALLDCIYVPWPLMQRDAAQYFAHAAGAAARVRLLTYGAPTAAAAAAAAETKSDQKTIDVLFYGTQNDARESLRRALIAALPGRVIRFEYNTVWGKARAALVRQARIVLNLHFYPEALLEVHRVVPLLREGACVLSEPSADTTLDARYAQAVTFASLADVPARCAALLDAAAWQARGVAARQLYAQLPTVASQLRAHLALHTSESQ